LADLCLALPGAGGVCPALDRLFAVLAGKLQTRKALALLCADDIDKFVSCAVLGMDAVEAADLARIMERSGGPLLATPAPFVLDASGRAPGPLPKENTAHRSRLAFIGAPIRIQNRLAGIILVDRVFNAPHPIQDDAAFLELMAEFAAGLIGLESAARLDTERLARIIAVLRSGLDKHTEAFVLVGQSRAARDIRWQVEHVAPSRAPVLLKGEPGTGKHRIARVIHHLSDRGHGPFVHADCKGREAASLEVLLFGGPKDTGASAMPGCLESASGGTLYLKSIEALGREAQARVLHFLRSREVVRADGSRTSADVRLIASTAHGLAEDAARGGFNSDLYYRISVLPLEVPPLRERADDIPALANHFLAEIAGRTGRRPSLAPGALNALAEQRWPKNADELKALLEKIAAAVGDGQADREIVEALLAGTESGPVDQGGKPSLKDMERGQVLAALERNAWVQRRAAKELGLTQRQIGYKIDKYGLKAQVARERARSRRKPDA